MTDVADGGDERTRLYADWQAANATAAALLRTPSKTLSDDQLAARFAQAEARASSIVLRYQALASQS
jgi:hypothetical protein